MFNFFFIQSDEEYIASLLSWTQANKHSSCIRKSSLLQFWSPGKRVGDLWVLYESQEGELSHNRHDPPAYSGIQGVIFDLLHNFHPRPFLQTRFEPRGGYAVLRAHDGNIVDIFIRYSDYFHLIIQYGAVLYHEYFAVINWSHMHIQYKTIKIDSHCWLIF